MWHSAARCSERAALFLAAADSMWHAQWCRSSLRYFVWRPFYCHIIGCTENWRISRSAIKIERSQVLRRHNYDSSALRPGCPIHGRVFPFSTRPKPFHTARAVGALLEDHAWLQLWWPLCGATENVWGIIKMHLAKRNDYGSTVDELWNAIAEERERLCSRPEIVVSANCFPRAFAM